MSSKDKTFKFSVVMPIYNTINFMREAIDSVINQTIGFEDNIQLILVDDGSNDGSDKVCEEYLAKYPDNVIFHKNEVNSRVSISRNNGIKYIEGEYVAFFDSDDGPLQLVTGTKFHSLFLSDRFGPESVFFSSRQPFPAADSTALPFYIIYTRRRQNQ